MGNNIKLMKTIKLKSDLFNKFSDFLKQTNPDEYFEIFEIKVSYNPKETSEKIKLQEDAKRINLLLEMSKAGMEVELSWRVKDIKELNKMFEDFKEEIKDFD